MTESYFIMLNRLDEDEQYADLSIHAKYLYGKMRDILKLSIRNNWQDENGFYIRMTRDRMAKLLKCSLPTVRKIVKELIQFGLLKEKREGLTKSNRLYVQLLPGENEIAFQCKARKNKSLAVQMPDRTAAKIKILQDSSVMEDNPSPKAVQQKHFWALREGDIFKYGNSFWIHEKGDITPYRFGEELEKETMALLNQIGMHADDVSILSPDCVSIKERTRQEEQ